MAITIKELLIKGKVRKDVTNDNDINKGIKEYFEKLKEEIIDECKEQIKEELEREMIK